MRLASVLVLLLLVAPALAAQKNVLLLIADDVGLDNVGAYGLNPEAAPTPHINSLAKRGVLFRNAYANPVCSPSRATILTGRYAWRTGMGAALAGPSAPGLALTQPTLADVLKDVGYGTAAIGKWHMANNDTQHALKAGFDHHLGSMGNISNYSSFPKNVDGTILTSTTYATTDSVNDALAYIDQMGETPWFLWVAFNSAHAPFHKPPPELHGYDFPGLVDGLEPLLTKAMIQAMDTEIGRLLEAVDLEDTLVVFVGDNGPDALSVTPPWDPTHAKHTVFDLGIHVSLIIAGAGTVKDAECTALVNTTDLYATIADVAGASKQAAVDSVSLAPYLTDPGQPSLRTYVYAERFVPNFKPETGWPGTFQKRMQSARNKRYKLDYEYLPSSLQVDPQKRRLYDLLEDPFETVNLLDEPLGPELSAVYTALRSFLVKQTPSTWTDLGGGLPGSSGIPLLEGEGSNVPGTTSVLRITGAKPGALGTLFTGFTQAAEPYACGVLLPAPDIVKPISISKTGGHTSSFTWPQVAGASPLTFQAWIEDPGSPCAFAATNALMGLTAP